jgi:hypothetical protein
MEFRLLIPRLTNIPQLTAIFIRAFCLIITLNANDREMYLAARSYKAVVSEHE